MLLYYLKRAIPAISLIPPRDGQFLVLLVLEPCTLFLVRVRNPGFRSPRHGESRSVPVISRAQRCWLLS